MLTIAEILKKCKNGDVVSDGIRKWQVVSYPEKNECVVAVPIENCNFELWSFGVESLAIIPNLKKL